MISLALLLVGVVLVALPGLAPVPLRVHPSEWSKAAMVSMLTGLFAIEIALVLWAVPLVLQLIQSAGIAEVCRHAMESVVPAGTAIGWIALLLAVAVPSRATGAARRAWLTARGAVVEPWLGHHEDHGDFELVVLPTAELLAMSVPAHRPQVLVSDGLIASLDDGQLNAVIRHEASHQRHRHWRFSLAAAAVAGALRPLPFARRSRDRLSFALEAWADDDAAGNVPSRRRAVREAMGALRGSAGSDRGAAADELAIRGRLRRLNSDCLPVPLPLRLVVFSPLFAGVGCAGALAVAWMLHFHHGQGLALAC